MQSLCAIAHYDFNAAGEYSYEQALSVIQRLNLGHRAMREYFRRMVFNVLARNQDDHTRNTAFLMDRMGQWRLAPAFDVVWAYNPAGDWTSRHQMTINGRRDGFSRNDLTAVAEQFGIKRSADVIEQVGAAVQAWSAFAADAGVPAALHDSIARSHRLSLLDR
jgi:serine/threonine-protein kinase HipA